jgi:Tfp pilus assembly PilM family ATPase/Tfp pilus assembly protein PilN
MNTTVIVEIGNPWLKLVVLRSAMGVSSVKAMAAMSFPNMPEDAASAGIADFLRDQKIKKPENLIVSFTRNAVTLRNLRIPSANANEIDDMIKLHVGRQVPYAKEEIVNGHRVIGKDTMGYSKVMLAIVHRESIRKIFRILEKAGLYTDRMELGSDGVLAWLCKATKSLDPKSGDAFIILDVDAHFTDFVVSTYENILFSRVIAQGIESLADETKWPKFLGEMKQTLVISQGEEVVQKPTKFFLTGGGASLKKLASTIELEFNLPVEVVEPLSNMPVAKDIVKKPTEALTQVSFSPLLGLGLDTARRKINFVLPEAQIRKNLRERTRDTIFFGSCLMYLVLISCGVYMEKMHNRQAYLDLIQGRYESIAKSSEDLNEKLERIKKIHSKLNTKSLAINYLWEISNLLPPEIVITSITFQNEDKLDLKGRTAEMSDVFKFITTLENSTFFKDIQTRYTSRKKLKGVDVNEFELTCPIETDKTPARSKRAGSGRRNQAREDL